MMKVGRDRTNEEGTTRRLKGALCAALEDQKVMPRSDGPALA